MTKKEILALRSLAHDIIHFNPQRKDVNNKQLMDAFYKIMSKHGIKQGGMVREWPHLRKC